MAIYDGKMSMDQHAEPYKHDRGSQHFMLPTLSVDAQLIYTFLLLAGAGKVNLTSRRQISKPSRER